MCDKTYDSEPGVGHHPFCSERCKLLDLGNWIDERYRVPVGRGGTPFADERDTSDDPSSDPSST